MQASVIIGLDVSKDTIDCHIDMGNRQQYCQISNNKVGYRILTDYLADVPVSDIYACCEATNVYWCGIAAYLYESGINISVVNPAAVKAYAQSLLKRIKNDKQDAKLIAAYCRQYSPPAWKPDSPDRTQKPVPPHLPAQSDADCR